MVLPKWRVLPAITSPVRVELIPERALPETGEERGASPGAPHPFWFTIAGGIWLAGVGFCVVGAATRHIELRQLLLAGYPVPGSTLALAMSLQSRRGIKRQVRVMAHPSVGSAFTCGVLQPAIVLPCNHEKMSRADLRMVLDHELAHVQRLDALHGLTLQVFVALWWFHPLAWLVLRSAEVVKERACDDLVLLSGEDPRRYAACLGEAVLRAHHHPAFPTVVSSFVRRAPHLIRMHAILDPTVDRSDLTARETFNVCAPAILTAVVLSSLGFKAAAELQPNRPTFLEAHSDEAIPSLWSHVVLPLARGAGIRLPDEPLATKFAITHRQSQSGSAFSTKQTPPTAHSKSHLQSQPGRRAVAPSRHARGNDLDSQIDSSGENQFFTPSMRGFPTGVEVPSFVISPVMGRPPLSGKASSVAVPSSEMESFSAGIAGEGTDSAAYGYISVEDAGVMVYSGITRPMLRPSSSGLDASAASSRLDATQAVGEVSPEFLIPSDSVPPASTSAVEMPYAGEVPASGGVRAPEDLGIRNLQPFISSSKNGGQLSVSVEVPEASANFWKAEASEDFKSWTDSKAIVAHQLSSGTSPGYLRLTASIVQPVSSAKHTVLRLKGKW